MEMENKISQIEKSKHFSGDRTFVTDDEKKKWIELWPSVREKVASNVEAYHVLSGEGLRYRDWRTIESHMEELLPLTNTKVISVLVELIDDCERRMPIKEAIRQIREKFPIEEIAPEIANVADTAIKELPPPDLVLKAVGSILSGGFPFDNTRDFR